MLAIGAGGLLSALVFRHRMTALVDSVVPSLEALTRTQTLLWGLLLEEGDPAPAFAEIEREISQYQRLARHEKAAQNARDLRSRLLDLREILAEAPLSVREERVSQLSEHIQQTLTSESEGVRHVIARNQRMFRWISAMNTLLLGGGLFLALIPGLSLARRIGEALQEANAAAVAVSGGDLTRRMAEKGVDEIGQLAKSFNQMVETLVQADAEITREVGDRIRAEQKAQAAARAKSDFLAHMSHEFRTPLNGILGYTQVLMLDRGLSEKNISVLQSLRRSGESLLELINDVLDLAKIEAKRMNLQQTRFYLRDFLDALRESYADQVRLKGLEFKLTLDPALPEDMLADPVRLRQILVNLIGNAIKFTDLGWVELKVEAKEKGLRFAVCDSGIGIAPEHMELVMQPFMQVEHKNRKNQGTGLGLSITHRLLEMMGGGGLHVESTPGKGTTFWFELPQPEGAKRRLVMAPDRITGYKGERRRILLAEDSREASALLAPLLRKTGFVVFETVKNMDMEACVREFAPHAVILDLHVEGGGEAFMRVLQDECERNELLTPAFVVFSDNRGEKDREKALAAGAAEFMPKPLRYGDLLKVLETLLSIEWELRDSGAADKAPGADAAAREALEIPPLEVLEALLGLALAGNVRQLREQAELLSRGESRYRPFAEQLLALSATYQINAIQALLRRHLPKREETQT